MNVFRLLRRPAFARFWVSTSASLLGSNVSGFALPTIAVATLGGSAAQIAGIAIVQTLAFPLLGMFAVMAVERRDKRAIMAVADIGRATVSLTVVACALLGHLSIAAITVAAAVAAVLGVLRDVCAQSLLPAVLREREIGDGNAALEFSSTASLSAGPAVAGILTSIVGAPVAIVVDAIAFVFSAVTLAGMRPPVRAAHATNAEPACASYWVALAEGLNWIWKAPRLLRIAGCTATFNLAASAAQTVSLLFFYRVLHLTPLALGILLATSSAGLAGAWLAPRLQRRVGIVAALGLAIAISTLGRFLLPLSAATPIPVVTAGVAFVIVSAAWTLYNIAQATYRQQITPLTLQARVHAAMRTINSSTVPVGAALGGVLASIAGPSTALSVCAAIAACSSVWLLAPSARARVNRLVESAA